MPRILFQTMIAGLRVYIYFKDHGLPHVHVYKGNPKSPEAFLKVEVESWEILEVKGFKEHAVNKTVKYLKTVETEIKEKWNEIIEK